MAFIKLSYIKYKRDLVTKVSNIYKKLKLLLISVLLIKASY